MSSDSRTVDIPQPVRGCHLDERFGPAFQAEYERLYTDLVQGIQRDEEIDEARHGIETAAGGALTMVLGPFGALFAEGSKAQREAGVIQNRQETIQRFVSAVYELCWKYGRAQRQANERYRWGWLAWNNEQRGLPFPTWEEWIDLTEAQKLEWLPADAEPLASLRARLVERQERYVRAKKMTDAVFGWLVTEQGRIIKGPFIAWR